MPIIVIFIGGLNKSNGQDCEDSDREGLGLSYGQDAVISALGRGKQESDCRQHLRQRHCHAVGERGACHRAGLVSGFRSRQLPCRHPHGRCQSQRQASVHLPREAGGLPRPNSLGEYTGKRSKDIIDIKYNESIFVGYRWADKQKKVKPLFPFGHGLSYTTFEYGKPTADSKTMQADGTLTVKVSVKNTGAREGQEVVQLYISDKKSSLPRPVKELKGFQKVKLAPGETKEVTFTIDKEALSFFDDTQHAWVAEPGKFEAVIAASAADVKGTVPFELK